MRSARWIVTMSCLIAVSGAGVLGCGGEDSEATKKADVQSVVERFGTAFAAQDAATICKDLLAPDLRKAVEGIGLSCERAIKQSTSAVRDPKLEVLGVAVRGDRGYVTARTTAKGQEASIDRLALVQTDDGWRITSLNTQDDVAPGASTTP